MAFKRNTVAVIITIIISALLLNIDQVLGQTSSQLPSATDPPELQATFEASKDTYITGANGNGGTNPNGNGNGNGGSNGNAANGG